MFWENDFIQDISLKTFVDTVYFIKFSLFINHSRQFNSLFRMFERQIPHKNLWLVKLEESNI